MAEPTQSNGGEPNGGGKPGEGGGQQPNNGGGQAIPGNGAPAPAGNQNQAPDLSTLSGPELEKVLENPNLWKLPRVQELVKTSQEHKKLTTQQQKDEEKKLQEQNEFKTLAEKREGEIEKLNGQIKSMTISQALTSKLVPEGVVDLDAALKLVDQSKLEVGEDGQVSGLDDAITSLKNDRAYLFNAGGGGQQTPPKPQVGAPSNPSNGQQPNQGGQFKYTRSQIADPKFYQEHRDDILEAQRNGLIDLNN